MVDAGERHSNQAKPPEKGNGVKTGRKEKGIQLDAEGRELRAHGKERDHREGFPAKAIGANQEQNLRLFRKKD